MTRRRVTVVALAAVLVVSAGVRHLLAGPAVVLLLSSGGAEWVRPDRPLDLGVHIDAATTAPFETTFTVPPAFAGATLSVNALRRVAVDVDARPVFAAAPANWKVEQSIPLPAELRPGRHRLRLTVTNPSGPALVRAACRPLGIATGHGDWGSVVPASAPWRPALADRWGPSAPALWRCLPLLAVLFTAGAGAAWCRPAGDWGRRLRWAVLAAWVVMGAADLYRVPLGYGYDAAFHYDYVRFVAEHGRLPPPDGGVQFFQAPLFYVAAAAAWRLLAAAGASAAGLPYGVRVVPLACGAGLAELCYRSARHAFPGRSDLHAVAVVVGGLVPMNLYMGLAVSNEPMAGLVGGAVALVGMRFLDRPADADRPRWWAVAGVLLGLAVLSKVSMGLWAVPLGAVLLRGRPARTVATVGAVAALVCGPFLLRTWHLAGTPVLSHTVLRNASWWQDPGYRTPRQLLTFGRGLTRVAYGGVDGVWDSLYSTVWGNGFLSGVIDVNHRSPWHFDLMSCGLWFGLVPTAAIVVGAVAGRVRGGRWFPVGSVGLFVAALLWVYLTLPIYSCAKGSYLLSTTPCLAVLAAAGLDRAMVGRRSRAVVAGLLTCWAVTSYGTYVVTG